VSSVDVHKKVLGCRTVVNPLLSSEAYRTVVNSKRNPNKTVSTEPKLSKVGKLQFALECSEFQINFLCNYSLMEVHFYNDRFYENQVHLRTFLIKVYANLSSTSELQKTES